MVNLFEWSRTQKNEIEFQPPFELIESNIDLYSQKAKQKNIQISNKVPKSTIAYFVKNLIDNVIRNLIDNAIKICRQERLDYNLTQGER